MIGLCVAVCPCCSFPAYQFSPRSSFLPHGLNTYPATDPAATQQTHINTVAYHTPECSFYWMWTQLWQISIGSVWLGSLFNRAGPKWLKAPSPTWSHSGYDHHLMTWEVSLDCSQWAVLGIPIIKCFRDFKKQIWWSDWRASTLQKNCHR